MGFVTELEVKKGKGLFGKIRWTELGKKLTQNKLLRWLSPVFRLDKETNEPVELVNVALTNMPSQPNLDPVVNSAPLFIANEEKNMENNENNENNENKKDTVCNTESETVSESETSDKTEVVEEVKEEVKEEVAEEAKPRILTREDVIEIVNECLKAFNQKEDKPAEKKEET
ncbi:phage protease [Fibrobacter sp.]|uniref:phage protease n=1 Tax=Fibrobacter sp. TaxID=35828 RepID=UPI00389071BF